MIHWPEYDLLVERLDPLFRNLLKMYRCTLKVHLQLCNNNRAEFIYFLLCVTTHKCSYITIMFVLSSLQFVEALKLLSSVFREFQLELLLWLLCRYLRVSSSSAKHKTNYYNITSGLHGSAPQYITVVLTQYFCLWGQLLSDLLYLESKGEQTFFGVAAGYSLTHVLRLVWPYIQLSSPVLSNQPD